MNKHGIVLVSGLLLLQLLGTGCNKQTALANDTADKHMILDLGKGVTMKLALVPAGKFVMGSPKSEIGRNKNEGPQHEVTISKPFYMGVTEVTQAQWKTVMEFIPWEEHIYAKSGDNYAASCVSWYRANEFCDKLSLKLGRKVWIPTEAQWEYACRAGGKTIYGFGDDASKLGDYAWCHDNTWKAGEKYTHKVGLKKPNAFGLYDMHGNVHEWCRDVYDEKFYANSKSVDPENITKEYTRILRGGSWCSDQYHCRSASRDWCTKGRRFNYYTFGLRIVVGAK
ncbi:MAG: formylglycine-generating enzyme family protein [Phycisphaerales bacterium]|jgi:formylglycine-generating enzyme required for sulfatase activity|nr:formylglycine-generating enzyme family protein [Phycisphaerales bacterium]